MSNDTKKLFQKCVDAATDLAESVKRNIKTDGFVDDKTVNALNDFMIATNELANHQDEVLGLDPEFDDKNETDPKLQ